MFKIKASDGKNNICGEKLKEIRASKGLSQRKLAQQMQLKGYDVDHYFIMRVESGERFITDIDLKIFCDSLNIKSSDILDF